MPLEPAVAIVMPVDAVDVFGELAAQEFVSVQPMNLPSGLIFYLDFKYGTAQNGLHTENSDVFGNTSKSNADATGGLYGSGKYDYSMETTSSAITLPSSSLSLYTTSSIYFFKQL